MAQVQCVFPLQSIHSHSAPPRDHFTPSPRPSNRPNPLPLMNQHHGQAPKFKAMGRTPHKKYHRPPLMAMKRLAGDCGGRRTATGALGDAGSGVASGRVEAPRRHEGGARAQFCYNGERTFGGFVRTGHCICCCSCACPFFLRHAYLEYSNFCVWTTKLRAILFIDKV